MDRSADIVEAPARDLSPEDLVAGIVFPSAREPEPRPSAPRGRPRSITERDDLAGPGAGRIDHGSRRGRRRAPETPGPDEPSADPYPEGPFAGELRPSATTPPRPNPVRRPPTLVSPPGHDLGGRPRPGGRRRAEDRDAGPYGVDGFAVAGPGDTPAPWDGPEPGPGPDLRDGRARPVDPHDLGYDPRDLDLDPDEDGAEPDPAPGPDDVVEDPPRRGRRRAVQEDARRRRWPWVVGVVAAAAAAVPIGLAVFGGTEDETPAAWREGQVAFGASTGGGQPGVVPATEVAAAPTTSAAAQITYEVTGSGSGVTITFGRGTSVAQVSGADLPWERTAPAAGEPTDYSVTAAGGSGELSCRILVDGAVISEESADGDYSAVSCNGRR
ncbi:MmpS family transport accessory protein [Pseudonocardia sp. ICBG162]|uniref:MmpS family transport accessory protein n=1 Tax=Pseudonocardia sp. ICBG162 TaxID=2846761 RepID=UPI001CF64CCC|nr:MmpS family transport accessory protein [Pseudonocardia sp. ICBG162]